MQNRKEEAKSPSPPVEKSMLAELILSHNLYAPKLDTTLLSILAGKVDTPNFFLTLHMT